MNKKNIYGLISAYLYIIKCFAQPLLQKVSKLFALLRCIVVMYRNSDSRATSEYIPLESLYKNSGRLCLPQRFFDAMPSCDLTIIIPMYNVSDYICECLTSVIYQKTKFDVEILLIDDGSTDNTIELIQPFLTDFRVKLIRQKNSGQSAARNYAINISRGQYLMMVDGDDVLLDGAIDTLMNIAEITNSEIAEGKVIRFNNRLEVSKNNRKRTKTAVYNNTKQPKFVLSCFGFSCAKVYHRTLWETLRYPEGYIFEDVITKFILRRKANKVVFIDTPVYGYRWNPNSSSHGKDKLKKLDSIWVLPRIIQLCEQEKVPKDQVFYILALNHIGMLNYATLHTQEDNVKIAGFMEMRKQLCALQIYRPHKLPIMFRLLEKTILDNNILAWEYVAMTINKYGMLCKWREIN